MKLCPTHSILIESQCPTCMREYFALLGANGLVHVRPTEVMNDRDLPLPGGPMCEAMNHNSVGGEVICERPARHEGDCDDGTGLMWDHDDTCGCFDEPAT